MAPFLDKQIMGYVKVSLYCNILEKYNNLFPLYIENKWKYYVDVVSFFGMEV